MKILEHGNTYKQIRCPHCNALLEYSDADIKNQIIDEWLLITYIKCIECDTSIILEGLTSCLN